MPIVKPVLNINSSWPSGIKVSLYLLSLLRSCNIIDERFIRNPCKTEQFNDKKIDSKQISCVKKKEIKKSLNKEMSVKLFTL